MAMYHYFDLCDSLESAIFCTEESMRKIASWMSKKKYKSKNTKYEINGNKEPQITPLCKSSNL